MAGTFLALYVLKSNNLEVVMMQLGKIIGMLLIVPLVMALFIACGEEENSSPVPKRRGPGGLPGSPQAYSITLMEADNGWKIHNLSISPNGEASAQVEDGFGYSSEYRGQGFVGGDAASVKLVKRVSGYEEYLPPAGIMLDLSGTIRPECFNATGFLSSYEDNSVFLNLKWEDLPDVAIRWGDLRFTDRVELRFQPC